MKANYTKPLLAVEMFSFVQTSARDCNDAIPKNQLNFNDPGRCVWDLGRKNYVFVPDSDCNIDGTDMDVGCYNNPTEGNYVFRS